MGIENIKQCLGGSVSAQSCSQQHVYVRYGYCISSVGGRLVEVTAAVYGWVYYTILLIGRTLLAVSFAVSKEAMSVHQPVLQILCICFIANIQGILKKTVNVTCTKALLQVNQSL